MQSAVAFTVDFNQKGRRIKIDTKTLKVFKAFRVLPIMSRKHGMCLGKGGICALLFILLNNKFAVVTTSVVLTVAKEKAFCL
jgi:hypothetical protein